MEDVSTMIDNSRFLWAKTLALGVHGVATQIWSALARDAACKGRYSTQGRISSQIPAQCNSKDKRQRPASGMINDITKVVKKWKSWKSNRSWVNQDATWPEDVDGTRNIPTKKIYETLMRTGMQWGILCGKCNDSEGREMDLLRL